MRKLFIGMFLFLIAAITVAIGFAYYKGQTKTGTDSEFVTGNEIEDLKQAEKFIAEKKPADAIGIIGNYTKSIEQSTPTGKQWLDLLIDASLDIRNAGQLTALYEYYPDAFENKEEAVLVVGGDYLQHNRVADYKQLRDNWKKKATMEDAWFVLDADTFLLEGKKVEAVALLQSKSFDGTKDVGRLIRLAMIEANEKPKEAWDHLTEASQKDPKNPVVRLYRARLLEGMGKTPLAHLEYLAAAQVGDNNPIMRDQLAEFYLRNNQFPLAVQIWQDSLKTNASVGELWVKSLFWDHVATPVKFDWATLKLPDSPFKPLLEYLLTLKGATFWNESAFEKIPEYQSYLKNQQSLYWLRLIQALKDKDYAGAETLLKFNAFKTESWAPEMELTLSRILQYRNTKSFLLPPEYDSLVALVDQIKQRDAALKKERPILFDQIGFVANEQKNKPDFKVPEDLEAVVTSNDAFTLAFVAGGWLEAGIQLHDLNVYPSTFPEWAAYAYTQALRYNRGNWDALEFASLQKESPLLDGFMGELLIGAGNPDAALDKLSSVAKREDAIGERSAWLISLIYIDKEEYEKAKQAITERKTLADSIPGKETLARIALLEKNDEVADKIYKEIKEQSSEAKSYLARKAFDQGDLKTARELTEALIREFPSNAMLHQNLKKIIDKQAETDKPKAETAQPNEAK